MNERLKESTPGGFTPFNHGYLCQMLRSASSEELERVRQDVAKEEERRANVIKEELATRIKAALKEAAQQHLTIKITDTEDNEDYYLSEYCNYDVTLF